ncbi:MAG: DUF692 domain-containing protein [Methylomicrobium sp.]|nr:DUF692 domain-containing protein [Methylomicrobium sp.]
MSHFDTSPVNPCVGVSFKPQYFADICLESAAIDFFEVHAENYMSLGGLYHEQLRELTRTYPLSVHGVGLSIGGTDPINALHLKRLKHLCNIYHPVSLSEHLAWSVHDGIFLNDLMPLVYDESSLARVISRIDQIQDYLGCRLLIENPARYIKLTKQTLDEPYFLQQVAERTGCGLLLDITNLYVSAFNLGFDPVQYLTDFPLQGVEEIHLAGHSKNRLADGGQLFLDDHGSQVSEEVWLLFQEVVDSIGSKPTLIEWDNNLPTWQGLCLEANKAREILEKSDFLLVSQGEYA